MKVLIVTEHEVQDPEDVPRILTAMNPPALPHFTGTARVVVDPEASVVTTWLDQ